MDAHWFLRSDGDGTDPREGSRGFCQGNYDWDCRDAGSLFVGGILSGLGPVRTLFQSLPVFLLAVLILAGLRLFPKKMVLGFQYFAAGIRILTIVGLAMGAVCYMLEIGPFFFHDAD